MQWLLPLLVLAWCASSAQAGRTVRAYFVGNSLTEGANLANLQSITASRGDALVYGKHIDFGAALEQVWANPNGADATLAPYGPFPTALSSYTWDAISLQPFQRPIDGSIGDRPAVANFINFARLRSPNARFYLYSGWPIWWDSGTPLDYDARWLRPYSGTWDDTIRTRDFYQQLIGSARQDFPSIAQSILLVPTGEVLFELNRRMHAGLIPGYSDVGDLYVDQLHLDSVGGYICALTFYATLLGEDPRGLPYNTSWIPNPVVAAQIQDTVWQVVRTHPLAGLSTPLDRAAWPVKGTPPPLAVPEPASISVLVALALAGLPVRRRRRACA